MSFLKNHYEKLILTFLLVLFAVMFGVHVLSVILETASASPADELLAQSILDHYTPLKLDSDELNPEIVRTKSAEKWSDDSETGNAGMLVPGRLVRCPKGKHLIPVSDFKSKARKCSYCGTTNLPVLAAENSERRIRQVDSDNDGIPDEIEIRNGLNPRDPKDAAGDLDKDGYSNLEEYRDQTNMRSPESHPTFANKLYVVNVTQKPLGFVLQGFKGDKKGREKNMDKKGWSARFIYYQKNKRGVMSKRGVNAKFGNTFELRFTQDKSGWVTYTFKDIQMKWDDNGGNRSLAVVTGPKDKTPIVVGIGKPAYDPHQLVTFIFDVGFERKREKTCAVGGKITLGNETVGQDRYLLVSADAEKKTVQLKELSTQQIILVKEWVGGTGDPQNGGMEEGRPEEMPEDRPVRRRPPRQRRGGGLPSFD